MRAIDRLQQLVHLVRRLLLWLGLGTRAARFDFMATVFLISGCHEFTTPHHGYACTYLFFYLCCRSQVK